MRRILLLPALLLVLTGCGTTALNVERPSYAFRDIRPRVAIALPLSASTIDFDFDIEVQNPNKFALRLDRIDFDVLVNDSKLVSSSSADRIRIPAEGIGSVHLRTRVGYDQLRSVFRQVADLVQGNRARYEMRGTAHFNTPLGQLQFPLTIYQQER